MNCSNIRNPNLTCHALRRHHARRTRALRAGMTLLEVILAIAILGGSLAMLGELVRTGTRAAREGRLLSTAQLLADSILAEITAGVSQPEATEGAIDFGGFGWSYIVEIKQVDQQGLLAVNVTVRESADLSQQATSYSLVQLMIDPQVEYELETAAAEAAASTSSSTGTESSSSGTSGATTESGTGTGGSP